MLSLKAWRANLIHFWLNSKQHKKSPLAVPSQCWRSLPSSRKCCLCCQIFVRGVLGGQCRCAGWGESQKSGQGGLSVTPLQCGFLPCLWGFQFCCFRPARSSRTSFIISWSSLGAASAGGKGRGAGVGWETFLGETENSDLGREGAKSWFGEKHSQEGKWLWGKANPGLQSLLWLFVLCFLSCFALLLLNSCLDQERDQSRSCPQSSEQTVSRTSREEQMMLGFCPCCLLWKIRFIFLVKF